MVLKGGISHKVADTPFNTKVTTYTITVQQTDNNYSRRRSELNVPIMAFTYSVTSRLTHYQAGQLVWQIPAFSLAHAIFSCLFY